MMGLKGVSWHEIDRPAAKSNAGEGFAADECARHFD
jgi:hypothetical protein